MIWLDVLVREYRRTGGKRNRDYFIAGYSDIIILGKNKY